MTQRRIALRADDTARADQFVLLALCILALVAAALVLPPVSGLPPPGTGTDGGGPIEIQPGNGTGPPVDDRVPVNASLDRECAVYVLDRPVPGTVVPVLVLQNGTRNADVPVRFNGRLVGETDEQGIVTGEVPYQRELEVGVDVGGDVDCAFVDYDEVSESTMAAGFTASTFATGQADPGERGNYSVAGDVQIRVDGEPHPGDDVDVLAAVDGVPMADAAVAIDGTIVARTGSGGHATVPLPNDGRETVTVRVSRGDFAGSTNVDLLVLRVGVDPSAPLAIPGGGATARATIAGDPVSDARVTLDGASLGTTDATGQVQFALPANPTATLVVEGADQRASTSLWPAYVPTIGVALSFLAVFAVAYWRDGVRGAVGLLAVVGVLVGAYLALYGVVRDEPHLAVAGGALVLAGSGALFWQRAHWRAATREGASDVGHFFARLAATVASLTYAAALALERFVLWAGDRLEELLERLRSTPRSVRGIATALVGWLVRLPARLSGLVGRIVRIPWRLLAWWRSRGEDDAADGTDQQIGRPAASTGSTAEEPFSLRDAWRRFARWVLPGPWRRRTPGEVARAAVSEGFPSRSVGELTDVFRDVEYGKRPLTDERRERAEEAFESLRGHRHDEEGGD